MAKPSHGSSDEAGDLWRLSVARDTAADYWGAVFYISPRHFSASFYNATAAAAHCTSRTTTDKPVPALDDARQKAGGAAAPGLKEVEERWKDGVCGAAPRRRIE